MATPWVSVRVYAETFSVDPRTVRKWAEAGLVELVAVSLQGKRPLIRVKNQPPVHMPVNTSCTPAPTAIRRIG
jgi:hypothetical protein